MFILLMQFLSIMTSSIFLFMIHPLAMGLMLLIQTLMISIITGMMTKTFWFSYTLFLIFIGGMLVLFIYITSLASNEMFNFSFKILTIISMFSFMLIITTWMMDKTFLLNYLFNNETMPIFNNKILLLENSLILSKIYNFPLNMMTIILMIYLFLTLIAVVKITNIFAGPLRMKNN